MDAIGRRLAVLVLVLAACGGGEEKDEGGPVFKIGTAAGEVRIRVFDPGREPRRPLRYDLKEGTEERMAMEMRMTLDLGGGVTPAISMPTIRMEMRLGPAARTDEGNLRLGFGLDGLKLLPGDGDLDRAARMEPMLKDMMEGFSGTMVVTPHGCPVSAEFTMPDSFPAHLRKMVDDMGKSMQQMPMIFPDEPVGVGARWEVDLPMEVMGLALRQKATYVLRELEGDRGRMDITLKQDGSGTIKMPGLAETAEARFEKLKSEGKGTLAFDLKSFVPRSEMDIRMEMKMTFTVQGERKTTETSMAMHMKIEPVE